LGFLLGSRRGQQKGQTVSQEDEWAPGTRAPGSPLLKREKSRAVETQPPPELPVQAPAEEGTAARAARPEEASTSGSRKKGKAKAGKKEVTWIEPEPAPESRQ